MSVVPLEAAPTDANRAATLRAQMGAALGPVLALMNEAKTYGMDLNFNIGPDAIGKIVVHRLTITKEL